MLGLFAELGIASKPHPKRSARQQRVKCPKVSHRWVHQFHKPRFTRPRSLHVHPFTSHYTRARTRVPRYIAPPCAYHARHHRTNKGVVRDSPRISSPSSATPKPRALPHVLTLVPHSRPCLGPPGLGPRPRAHPSSVRTHQVAETTSGTGFVVWRRWSSAVGQARSRAACAWCVLL